MSPTPVEAFVKARRLGITFRLADDGRIRVALPEGMSAAPAWLSDAKRREPDGMAFAVAFGQALENAGGNVGALLGLQTIEIRTAQ